MDDGRIPKHFLYGELDKGGRDGGHPHLEYTDVCKRDLKADDIDVSSWEIIASERYAWKHNVKH